MMGVTRGGREGRGNRIVRARVRDVLSTRAKGRGAVAARRRAHGLSVGLQGREKKGSRAKKVPNRTTATLNPSQGAARQKSQRGRDTKKKKTHTSHPHSCVRSHRARTHHSGGGILSDGSILSGGGRSSQGSDGAPTTATGRRLGVRMSADSRGVRARDLCAALREAHGRCVDTRDDGRDGGGEGSHLQLRARSVVVSDEKNAGGFTAAAAAASGLDEVSSRDPQ